MYILGLNGPPHCGKDSIANEIERLLDFELPGNQNLRVEICSLARPMRLIGMGLLGLDPENDSDYAEAKETPFELFRCTQGAHWYEDNLRQFMIWISESAIKSRYGRDFWARKAKIDLIAEDIWNDDNALVLIPDIGFAEEPNFFEREIGAENFLLAQVERSDCDWQKDSRRPVIATNTCHVFNNKTLGWAAQELIARMTNLGWKLD